MKKIAVITAVFAAASAAAAFVRKLWQSRE